MGSRTIDVCVYAELMLESKALLDAAEGDLARRQQQQVRGLGSNEAEAIHQQRLREAAARRTAPAPIADPEPELTSQFGQVDRFLSGFAYGATRATSRRSA